MLAEEKVERWRDKKSGGERMGRWGSVRNGIEVKGKDRLTSQRGIIYALLL